MKFQKSCLRLSATMAIWLVSAISLSAAIKPPPPPSPLKGNGIYPTEMKPLSVSLNLTPASNDGITAPTLGGFEVQVEKPRFSGGVTVKLNLYRVVEGQEKIVATVGLDEMARVLGGPGSLPPAPAKFSANLADKTKFPAPLEPGYFRAEAVVYTLTPPISKPIQSDPRWIEAGGAAVDFYVGSVNLLPVVQASGGMQVSAIISPRRGATKIQLDQLNVEARRLVSRISTSIKGVMESQAISTPTAPTRDPWLITSYEAPNGLYTSWKVSAGQSYQHVAPEITWRIASLVRSGTYSLTLPGGNIRMTTSGSISFSK